MAGFRQLHERFGQEDACSDLLVIGGGINGAGIAADASGRGLSVVLVDGDDWGHATSSASTKLIHGGLRYLEQWQFRMVRESLQERRILMEAAPHIVEPLEFHLVHSPEMRPFWMIWLGMKLYDTLAGSSALPASSALRFNHENSALKPQYTKGFSYFDCRVDDARLVLENVKQAQSRGACVASRTKCTGLSALPDGTGWKAELTCQQSGQTSSIKTKCVINATGPWASYIDDMAGLNAEHKARLRLVKGSHIVVPALYEGDQAYLLQLRDGRIIFTIPYQDNFTMIGTTDEEIGGDPGDARISAAEVTYLCEAVSEYFTNAPVASDVVWQFAGVRPLEQSGDGSENASQVSRDYRLSLASTPAPLLSVYGGKLTSYRALAEAAMDTLGDVFPQMTESWTSTASLPGAPKGEGTLVLLKESLQAAFPVIEPGVISRWLANYGAQAVKVMDYASKGSNGLLEAGPLVGPGLYKAELDFLINEEWAETAEDVLWRRSKLGLHWTDTDVLALTEYLRQ
ncbi:glycerol-3-phosphate dehydrogenase [Pseudohongiella nitratireducens]|uniref:Glycerol-3-phosphate dehydrogenase n=1 Tax=Pseudohongiella nitratireducens TaxID=1768907 RepID=A0A916VJE2_9GAMM|nr:glycerol-3-phosphate dehydrogenase [Pseudohongiella nitratireducens]GFZ78035.1 glycerol-3-phosphate dehydrogenase [Pseudohongiella nitratireducens]